MNPFRHALTKLGWHVAVPQGPMAIAHTLLSVMASNFDASPDTVELNNPFAEVLRRLDAYRGTAGYRELQRLFRI